MSVSKKRDYTHIKLLEEKIFEMVKGGYTQREIAEYFGFKNKYVVKGFLRRQRKNELNTASGILPRRRGRPPKGYLLTEQDKDQEIKRLKMENELLRDFLRLAGRK